MHHHQAVRCEPPPDTAGPPRRKEPEAFVLRCATVALKKKKNLPTVTPLPPPAASLFLFLYFRKGISKREETCSAAWRIQASAHSRPRGTQGRADINHARG